jgi:CheY-like chemotaxis protein
MTQTRIALVDDEASVRVALGRLLRMADYEVLAYASGEEFLAALGDCMPDCALLDVHLPGLTGIEVQMRLLADHVQLPVVFITASDDPAIDPAPGCRRPARVAKALFQSGAAGQHRFCAAVGIESSALGGNTV